MKLLDLYIMHLLVTLTKTGEVIIEKYTFKFFIFHIYIFLIEHAEADTFFCFTNLMSEIRDFFIKSLDEAEFGINSMMGKLTTQVKVNDPEVWMRLHQQELCPQYYSFR